MSQVRPASVRTFAVAASLVLAACVFAVSVARPAAQSAAPVSPLGQLVLVDVKPESWDDYVALQKNETMPALQKAGVERRRAWRATSLGKNFRVAYLYPLKSFAVFDEDGPIVRALGKDGAKAYNARLRRYLNGVQYSVFRTRTDLSYGLEGAASKLGVVSHVRAVPGKQFALDALLKNEWAPALKKAGVPLYVVQEIVMGGGMGEYYTFTPLEKYGALDAGHPIQKALGPAEYQALVEKMGPAIASVDREVMWLDEALSWDAAKTGTK